MLMLPTGQVLYTDQSNEVEIYTAAGSPNPAWAPTITSSPAGVMAGNSYTISGTQFNGLSGASAYGDDEQNETNYPLVRITNNSTGHVFYCREYSPSTMAICTGAAIVSTNFTVPSNIESGPSTIQIVTNGIASPGVPVGLSAPNITSITPTSAATGTTPTITVNGTNFVSSSVVQFNGTNLTTTYVSSTQLTAKLTTTNTANGGVYPITVVNPGNVTSNSVSFTLNFSVPTFSSVSPNSIPQGSGNTTVSISGYGIYSATTVLVNGTAVSSTYVSARALTAVIPASDLTSVGTLSLKLKNPTPGGGTSSALSVTVTASAPAPTVASINPTSGTAGSSFTLTVTGTNFVSGSTIQWNGTGIATTYVSATQLTGQVTSSNTASAGTYPIAVINPGPQTSNSVNFTVNPALAITSLNPSSAPQGSSLTLTVNGTGFVNGSTVEWNGGSLGTTYVSSTQLTAQVTSGNTANVGTDAVTVVNPDSTTSNSVSFTVSSGLTVTSISPSSALTGGTATMTVTGSGFVSGAVVQFNGASLTTTFVSSTQLTAKVTATNTASTGVFPITVVNPGGATSNSVNFSVNNPVATISSVTPNTIAVGSGDTTITISGYGLLPTSTVLINGTAVSTTYVSAREITAVIPASYLAQAGSLSVQVKNPAPGGGTTAKTTITVQ